MILAHITQPSRMPLCPPVPCLPSVWVPVLSSAVPGHARVPVRGVISSPVLRLRPLQP